MTETSNLYPDKPGVIEKGAYADILIVDGDPLEDISILDAHPKMFDIAKPHGESIYTINPLMKNSKIYKNTLK